MTDLFIVFFEIGFKMLNSNGIMSIITPSSWLTSKAGTVLRDHIIAHRNLSGAIDLEHFQAFKATTYTLISKFDTKFHDSIAYKTFDGTIHSKHNINYDDFIINKQFFLNDKLVLDKFRDIRLSTLCNKANVKNGFATLADKIFIGELPFSDFTIDVLKGSTNKWKKCFFPYDKQGKPIPEMELQKHSMVYDYLLSHKEELTKGRKSENKKLWYLFGRSQAIKDVHHKKIAINSVIKDINSIKLTPVPAGKGIYSGLYILTDEPFETIEAIVKSDDFINYITTLKNYKSGGYYTFSTKDLEIFINYKLQSL